MRLRPYVPPLTQVLCQSMEREDTKAYVAPEALPTMHKIVLQTPKNTTLGALAAQLREAEKSEPLPPHYLWLEQPENIATCLAMAPNRKPEALTRILKKCTLLRA